MYTPTLGQNTPVYMKVPCLQNPKVSCPRTKQSDKVAKNFVSSTHQVFKSMQSRPMNTGDKGFSRRCKPLELFAQSLVGQCISSLFPCYNDTVVYRLTLWYIFGDREGGYHPGLLLELGCCLSCDPSRQALPASIGDFGCEYQQRAT